MDRQAERSDAFSFLLPPSPVDLSKRIGPYAAALLSLTLPSIIRRRLGQEEHGADTADSEELSAAKAILDEVEPLLEES